MDISPGPTSPHATYLTPWTYLLPHATCLPTHATYLTPKFTPWTYTPAPMSPTTPPPAATRYVDHMHNSSLLFQTYSDCHKYFVIPQHSEVDQQHNSHHITGVQKTGRASVLTSTQYTGSIQVIFHGSHHRLHCRSDKSLCQGLHV